MCVLEYITKMINFQLLGILGCACFPEIVQKFIERQILWSLCSVDFHAFALKLPIQTSISGAPELSVCLSSHEKCPDFRKTSANQKPTFCSNALLFDSIMPFFVGCVEDRVWSRMREKELLWILVSPAATRCRGVQHDDDRKCDSTTARGS